jgi:hypothetical protein
MLQTMTGEQHVEFVQAVGEAAGRVAAVLGDAPLVPGEAYPLAFVVRRLTEEHDVLLRLVDAYPDAVGRTEDGRADRLGAELAVLMSYLQLVRTLYHWLDDVPDALLTNAGRNLSATHLTARKVRDHAAHAVGHRRGTTS